MRNVDIVCGMDLTGLPNLAEVVLEKQKFFFCSEDCKSHFQQNPVKYRGRPLIELHDIWKVFDLGKVKVEALRSLSLRIWPGDFTVIIGASGSGKSTALNIVGLLDQPTSGKVLLNNQDVSLLNDDQKSELRSQTFGFVFQQFNLVPWLSAFDNVTLPLIFSGQKVERRSVERIFEEVGLRERMTHRPFELSGGEQQRVSLARALVNDPEIILADEPTGNLDLATGNKILEFLIMLKKKRGKTLVIVTHDRNIAAQADQVLIMRDGTLIRDHHVQIKQLTE